MATVFESSDVGVRAPTASPLSQDRVQPQRTALTLVPARVRGFSAAERLRMIERLAYLRAEQRGFTPGHEMDDWLWAESQVDITLAPR